MLSLSPSKLFSPRGTVQCTRTSGKAFCSARMAEKSLQALTSASLRFFSRAKDGISSVVKSAVTMLSLSPSKLFPPTVTSQRMCASGNLLSIVCSFSSLISRPRRSMVSALRAVTVPSTKVYFQKNQPTAASSSITTGRSQHSLFFSFTVSPSI